MKKFLSTVMLLMLALTLTASAADDEQSEGDRQVDRKPLRIARLPLIIIDEEPDEDALAGLELKISRAIHIPLNGTLKAVEYLPTAKASEELQNIWKKLRKKNKKAKLQEAMEPLAKELDADMVICSVLRRYRQEEMIGASMLGGENKMLSSVEVQLIVFESDTGEITSKRAARTYNGEDSNWGTARFLADDCMSEVIVKTELREKVLKRTPLADRKEIERAPIG